MPLSDLLPQPAAGYLDAVAGQPLAPATARAWRAASEQGWSDPARLHAQGRKAGALLDAARASLAASLGATPDQIYLCSSGPTAVQLAVQGLAVQGLAVQGLALQRSVRSAGAGAGAPRIVVSAVESMAVQQPAAATGSVDQVPVDGVGRVNGEQWHRALHAGTALACLQAANGEVGTRQPLAAAAHACAEAEVPLLVHAVQVIGRDDVPDVGDAVAMSARDWGGPAGVGVLIVRSRWRPDQSPDRGWVGGFPDVPGAVAAATALENLLPVREQEADRARAAIDLLRERLPHRVPGLTVVGDPIDRLPHVLTMVIDDVVGEQVVHELARRGVSAASGSACTSDTRMHSQVLAAMGLADRSSLRIALPLGFPEQSIDMFLSALPDAVTEARR